jgi:hypothetical protein
MNKQIYAVGLKNYIELRTASKPPQLKVTKRIKKGSLTFRNWEHNLTLHEQRSHQDSRSLDPYHLLDFRRRSLPGVTEEAQEPVWEAHLRGGAGRGGCPRIGRLSLGPACGSVAIFYIMANPGGVAHNLTPS